MLAVPCMSIPWYASTARRQMSRTNERTNEYWVTQDTDGKAPSNTRHTPTHHQTPPEPSPKPLLTYALTPPAPRYPHSRHLPLLPPPLLPVENNKAQPSDRASPDGQRPKSTPRGTLRDMCGALEGCAQNASALGPHLRYNERNSRRTRAHRGTADHGGATGRSSSVPPRPLGAVAAVGRVHQV